MFKTNKQSYDPDYEHWEFGKLSAMREIALAIEDGYKYYYMGKLTLIRRINVRIRAF
jgi:hypothetical protein